MCPYEGAEDFVGLSVICIVRLVVESQAELSTQVLFFWLGSAEGCCSKAFVR